MTPLARSLLAIAAPPRIGADGFWVPDPTPEQAARMWMHEMNRRSLEAQRESERRAAEQAELQRNEWKLCSALSSPPCRHTEPPASANAELKAVSIIPHS